MQETPSQLRDCSIQASAWTICGIKDICETTLPASFQTPNMYWKGLAWLLERRCLARIRQWGELEAEGSRVWTRHAISAKDLYFYASGALRGSKYLYFYASSSGALPGAKDLYFYASSFAKKPPTYLPNYVRNYVSLRGRLSWDPTRSQMVLFLCFRGPTRRQILLFLCFQLRGPTRSQRFVFLCFPLC